MIRADEDAEMDAIKGYNDTIAAAAPGAASSQPFRVMRRRIS